MVVNETTQRMTLTSTHNSGGKGKRNKKRNETKQENLFFLLLLEVHSSCNCAFCFFLLRLPWVNKEKATTWTSHYVKKHFCEKVNNKKERKKGLLGFCSDNVTVSKRLKNAKKGLFLSIDPVLNQSHLLTSHKTRKIIIETKCRQIRIVLDDSFPPSKFDEHASSKGKKVGMASHR